MNKLPSICIILALFIFWPQLQGPSQSVIPSQALKKLKDSIPQLNQKIETKFDSIAYEINRIAHRSPRYVTRTHVHKVNHYRIDTVMVFVDTCFNKPQIDTAYFMPETTPAPDKKRTWLQKLFHKKPQRQTYLKVVDQQ